MAISIISFTGNDAVHVLTFNRGPGVNEGVKKFREMNWPYFPSSFSYIMILSQYCSVIELRIGKNCEEGGRNDLTTIE